MMTKKETRIKMTTAVAPAPIKKDVIQEADEAPRKRRVFWDGEEKDRVIGRAIQLGKDHPSYSILKLIREAQTQTLPPERQRVINAIKAIDEDIIRRVEVGKKFVEQQREPEPLVLPGSVVQIEVPVRQTTEEVLGRMPTSLLLACVIQRIVDTGRTAFNAWLRAVGKDSLPPAAPNQPLAVPTYPVAPPIKRPDVPRICIVGITKPQFQRIEEQTNGRAKLLWLDKDQSKTQVPVSADYMIAGRWLDHRWVETGKKTYGNDRVYFLQSVSEQAIIQKVYDICSIK